MLWIYHSLSNYSFNEGNLGYLEVLAITNKAVMNIHVYFVWWEHKTPSLWEKWTGVQFLGLLAVSRLVICETLTPFSKWLYIITGNV